MLVGLDLCFVLSLALVYITRKKRGKSENYKTPRNESQTLKELNKTNACFQEKLICYDMFQRGGNNFTRKPNAQKSDKLKTSLSIYHYAPETFKM